MAFPSIVSSVSGVDALPLTTHPISTLPSGTAGDLLLGIFMYEDNATPFISAFPGWTFLSRHQLGSAPDAYVESWYRVTDGTETGATITTTQGTHITWAIDRIADYQGVPVEAGWVGNVAVGVTSTDCPALTSGFGSVDTLWIAAIVYNSLRTVTGIPSGYTAGVTRQSIGTAYKTATAASEDPGTFTLSSDSWQIGNTFAIQGSAAPTAEFSGSETSLLTVDFADESTGGPTSWAWTFGDGGTSTLQNPQHVYAAAGTYTVSLTATNSHGSDSVSHDFILTVTPPYVPPEPSNAVIEIYASPTGSARWDVSHWDEDVWSAAQWIDVTPESVDATVRWGAHAPERGILAETEAATWLVNTYDPARLLDPGNVDSPYHGDLKAGLPIRIRHRGTIVRQGVCETIAYFYADDRGGIRVTDNLSLLARSPVPDDSILSDTLRARARDVIAAAGLSITVEPDPPSGDPALAPRLTDVRSVWRHIADAAEQTLHVAYIDRLGVVRFRAWASPYDRGRGVDATQLIDLGTIVQTAGLFSVIQAQQTAGDGGLLIERRATPVPQYGAVVYSRTDETPDADAWAEAVLADRSLQTVQWIPGRIYPLTADDVESFATIEAIERFSVDNAFTTPDVDIAGIVVGGEFTVRGKKDSAAVWSFEFELAQTATSPLYTDTDPAEFLLNEAGDGYLYAG